MTEPRIIDPPPSNQRKRKTMTAAFDQDRPYPNGIAWDEAWRQRQRADELERRYQSLWERFVILETEVAEYHDDDPRSMGWVGTDGLP